MRTRAFSICALMVVGGCAQHQQRAPETSVAGQPQAAQASAAQHRESAAQHRETTRETQREPSPERVGVSTTQRQLERDGTAVSVDDQGAPRAGVPADNTEINERDRASASLTPMDQSESEPDRELLQRIRKAVIADDSLSFSAKNVKIITRDGQVTLRGAVANAREKDTLEKVARDAAGPKRVSNQLEVAN